MMKMVMKRAWQIYRGLIGDKIAKLSMALRQAWAEAKKGVDTMEEKIAGIVKKYDVRIATNGTQIAASKFISKPQNADDLNFVKSHKQEIIAHIKAEEAKKEEEHKEYIRKLDGIEGLKEIRAALADLSRWHDEFNRSFDDVGGLGVRQKPQYDLDAMYAMYPRAAAYIKADSYSDASHYAKDAAGRKAKQRILDGEDPAKVIAEMEAEWSAYCQHSID